MKPRPANATLKDVARRCGVTTTTVWRALAGEAHVSPATAARVLAVARELGYSPAGNRAARRMASIRLGKPFTNYAVALLLPPSAHFQHSSYYHEIHLGILDGLADEGYDLLAGHLKSWGESAQLPHAVLAGEVDGAIVLDPGLATRLRALPGFRARPIVR
jgi:DNA-binding LacI/PurR family transcriptional regulator